MTLFTAKDAPQERLIADLKSVLAHAEEFVKASGTQSGEKLAGARERVEQVIADARLHLADAEAHAARAAHRAIDAAKEASRRTETTIKDHPWAAVGTGVGVGLIIGLLIGRR